MMNRESTLGGCNGLSYTLNYVEEKPTLDEEVTEHGVRMFIEPKALFHIVGTTMDYIVRPESCNIR